MPTVVLLALCLFPTLALPNVARAQGWPRIYDPMQLQIMEMYMYPGDYAKISGDSTFSIEVPAAMHLLGQPWILVAVRRKSGTPVGKKISMKVDINELVPGQTWHGVKKLSLENGDDADVLAEGFAWHLHRAAAASVPGTAYRPGLATWTALLLNGAYLGVFVNVEQPDKTFMKNRNLYGSTSSWLYKMSGINSPELKVGSGTSPMTSVLCYPPFVAARTATCKTPDATTLAGVLPNYVEMDALMLYAGASAFHAGPDQLFSHGKNFYYLDRIGARRLYLPWDLDSVFTKADESIFGRKQGGRLIQSEYQKIILSNPIISTQYKAALGKLVDGALSPTNLQAWLTRLEQTTLLPLALRLDPNGKLSADPHSRFDSLRNWVALRAANIRAQLK